MGGERVIVKRSTRLVMLVCAVSLAATCSTSTPPDPGAAYAARLQAERNAKDESFRRQVNQPVPAARQQLFLPLKYFPVDQDYAVTASFTAAARTPLRMPTSTGVFRDMEQVGTLAFTLKGRGLSLAAFVEAGAKLDRLFVPFTDLTSGTETYPAGRYLELDLNSTGIYIVDFNRAFHPYCYYNDTYDCPYPPLSNRLPIPVRAGEKLAASNIPSAGR